MDNKSTGELIFRLRREKKLTQKQLAEKMNISDRTVSKWECGAGCPDVSLLPELSKIFGVNIERLLSGSLPKSDFVSANMKKSLFYVCPNCGNVTVCTANADISCCGRVLLPKEVQKADENHLLEISEIEDEWYITTKHPMVKEHYISFLAFACDNRVEIIKQYPEWNMESRINKQCHGDLIWYCTKHGMFSQRI